jgi:hypothetical protein
MCVIKTYVEIKYICSSKKHMLCLFDVLMFVMLVMCCLNNMCHVFLHTHNKPDNMTHVFLTIVCYLRIHMLSQTHVSCISLVVCVRGNHIICFFGHFNLAFTVFFALIAFIPPSLLPSSLLPSSIFPPPYSTLP